MHWSKLELTDQIFTYIDPKTKEQTTFAATRLRAHCDFWKSHVCQIAWTPITVEDANLMLTSRGLETPRLRRAHKTRQYQPLLYLHMLDGTHLLIDGSHSYFAMQRKGRTEALSYIVEPRVWQNFLVEGLADLGLADITEAELLNSHSGIAT